MWAAGKPRHPSVLLKRRRTSPPARSLRIQAESKGRAISFAVAPYSQREGLRMDEATRQDAYGGYGFALRTFWFEVTDLRLHRSWTREFPYIDKPSFSSVVNGRAVSKDSVGVIGREGAVKEFNFSLMVDTDAKDYWEWNKAHDVLTYTDHSKFKPEHIRIKKLIGERLDKNPPTAVLFTDDDDWEVGTKACWSIECKVPREVFDKIEEELAMKTVGPITIGVKWVAGLVRDEHCPPSLPTTWGLFCLEENRLPESLRGHVSKIGWSPTSQDNTTTEETGGGTPAPMPAHVTSTTPAIWSVPKSAIAALWTLALAAVIHLFN